MHLHACPAIQITAIWYQTAPLDVDTRQLHKYDLRWARKRQNLLECLRTSLVTDITIPVLAVIMDIPVSAPDQGTLQGFEV